MKGVVVCTRSAAFLGRGRRRVKDGVIRAFVEALAELAIEIDLSLLAGVQEHCTGDIVFLDMESSVRHE